MSGATPAFAIENPIAHAAEPVSDWEWTEVSYDKGVYDKKPIEDLKPSLTVDTNEMYGVGNKINYTFTFYNVKPESKGTITFYNDGIAIDKDKIQTVSFTADKNGTVKKTITVTIKTDVDPSLHTENSFTSYCTFTCVTKVKKEQKIQANVELLKKADGTFDLTYKFPKNFIRTVKLIPSLPIISDLPIHLPDGTAITPQPQPKNPENSFISPSSNSFADSTADSMSIHLVDGTSGKSLDGENFVSYRLTLTIQDKKGDVIVSSTPYESTNPHLPSEITFKNLQLTKDFNQDNYTCSSEIKFLTVPQNFETPPNEQLVFPFKVHSQTEENLQVDDPSEILHSLLQTDHNIKSNNNYKNADKQLQETYDKAISDGQKIYDKLSSSPEEVKSAVQAIQSAIDVLNGDQKEKEVSEKLSTQIQKLKEQLTQLQSQLTKANSSINADKNTIQQLNSQIFSLSQQIDDLKNQISQKDKEIEKLKAEKFQCPNDQDKQKLESQITQLQKEKADLQNKVKSLQKQLEQAKQQIKDLKKNETKQPLSNQDLILPTKPINNSNSLQNKINVQPADNQTKEKTVTAIKQEEDIDKTITPKEYNSGSNTPQQSSDDQQPINPTTKVEKKVLPKTNDLLAMPFTSLSSLLVTVGSIVLKRRLIK